MEISDYNKYINKLKSSLILPLPGAPAHDILAPEHRKTLLLNGPDESTAQLSSVLILFFPDKYGRPSIVLMKRVDYKGVHSGQISFPGGKSEKYDVDFYDTAYREAEEEIGISRSECTTLGALSKLYVPPSNFLIFPVVASTDSYPKFKPDPGEVAKIITVPFDFFLKDNSIGTHKIKINEMNDLIQVPGYMIDDNLVWGATAMILSELILVVKGSIGGNG